MKNKRNLIAVFIVVAIMVAALAGSAAARPQETLQFDVAEVGLRFVFDEGPVHEDGFPAYGNPFITEGYIYPGGTLDESNGVLANGEPEFPDIVLGKWTCRGWFVGDGYHTATGPVVITTQYYDLGDVPGETSLVIEGYELIDAGESVQRAVTGGTGAYQAASGQAEQVMIGMNASDGVNLHVEVQVSKK